MATTSEKTHLDLELGRVSCSSASASAAEIVRVVENKKNGIGVGGEAQGGSAVVVDLGNGGGDVKVERDCRICHMSLESPEHTTDLDSAIAIELGCACKDDLAAAHKHCAEAWFKIKGNRTCEICGSVARNVTGPSELEPMEHWSESNDTNPPPRPAPPPTETQSFWRGHRFLNFLLACMVFAFVISWLFHFNIHLRET